MHSVGEFEAEKQSYKNVPEEELEGSVLEATGEFHDEMTIFPFVVYLSF